MQIKPLLGQTVAVLEPFAEDFPHTYEVVEIITHPDGQVVCILSDDAGGFDPKFLQEA